MYGKVIKIADDVIQFFENIFHLIKTVHLQIKFEGSTLFNFE